MTAQEIEAKLKAKLNEIRLTTLSTLEVEGLKSVRRNFEAEGRPSKWLPKKRADGRKILRGKTGRLFARTIAIMDEANNKVEIGNDLPYGRIHQEGGEIHRKAGTIRLKTKGGFASKKHKRVREVKTKPGIIRIPARPYLVIPTDDFPRIINQIKEAVAL